MKLTGMGTGPLVGEMGAHIQQFLCCVFVV